MLHTHVICCDCVEFRDEILLRGEEYKTRENFNFLKKCKNDGWYFILGLGKGEGVGE